MKLFYTDHFELPLPDGHRFPMEKYRLLRTRVEQRSATANWELLVPSAATDAQLQLAHTEEYLTAVVEGDLTALDQRRVGFPWSPELVIRSRYSTGATICAAEAALADGVSINLAGGTHHAFADAGAGYCVFNDAVVAARVLQQAGGVQRVAVVDCDVHQGNGTADITRSDPSIFTLSLHGDRNYPFRKAHSDIDISLPDRCDDATYLAKLRYGLRLIGSRFQPDLVIYLAGADPFAGDRLGRLSLTKDALRERDETVLRWSRSLDAPVAIAMAGGYAANVEDIVDIHFQTVNVADTFVIEKPNAG